MLHGFGRLWLVLDRRRRGCPGAKVSGRAIVEGGGREHVIAGTDCGFAEGAFMQRVHPSIMWAKLQALAEGARLATKQLWGR